MTAWQYWPRLWAKEPTTISLPPPKNQHQQSINDYLSCIMDNSRAEQRHIPIIIMVAAFLGNNGREDIATIC
jgi:hypothetical protein